MMRVGMESLIATVSGAAVRRRRWFVAAWILLLLVALPFSGKAQGVSRIFVDTAGRLHTRQNLMQELEKIRRVAARAVPGSPHEVLIVLDATVGQNGLVQAQQFMEAAGVTGVVLTKLDGTAKGGVAVAIAADLKLPIRFVGVGESIDDLIPFSADDYVTALFEEKW